jgi:molybdate transport system substrate-binding protein
MSIFRWLSFIAVSVLAISLGLYAQAPVEVTLLAPGSIRAATEAAIPAFEAKTGYKVKATFGSGGGTKQQIARGEQFDVPILQPPYPEVLASGNVVADSATPLASVSIGVAVKKGAPKPDISTPDAVKKMLLAAKSVSYPDATNAAAGISVNETLKQLGIADQLQGKTKFSQGGAAAMTMVAKGETEIGLTFMGDMSDPGIDVVGALPKEISPPTEFVGFVHARAKDPAAARALLSYLASPEASAAYKTNRMQPAH